MCDCRKTFDECAFENVGPKQNRRRISFLIILESKFRNIAVGLYIKGGNVNVIVLGHVLGETNLSNVNLRIGPYVLYSFRGKSNFVEICAL